MILLYVSYDYCCLILVTCLIVLCLDSLFISVYYGVVAFVFVFGVFCLFAA